MSRFGYALWIAFALACGSAVAEGVRWAPDVATARRAAMEYKVPVMIHFYGDNCLPCKLLEQNVYSRPEIVDTLNKYFICVRVNGSQDRPTAAQYNVHSWPTDVFLGPDGKPLDQGTCKQNPGEYLSVLHNMAVLNRDRNVLLASQQTESAKQVTSQLVGYAQPAATQPAATQPISGQPLPSQPLPGQSLPGQSTGATGQPAGFVQTPPAAAGLPTPGAPLPGNPNGPNFYVTAPTAPQAQLPLSMSPTGVNSGPLLAHQQPQAVTTAVTGTASQIAPGSAARSVHNTSGQLPPVQATAQVPPAAHPTQLQAAHMQVAGAATVPTVSSASMAQQTPTPSVPWQLPANRSQATASQFVENPHFPGMPPVPGPQANASATSAQAVASVATPAASAPQIAVPPVVNSSPRVPANTVSFQPRAALSVEANRTAAATQPSAAWLQPSTTAPAAATQSAPALDGFCPVTLKRQGAWIKGEPQWAVRHRGKVYHLSSQAAVQEFLQSPDRSSPVLTGYDPMVFLNEGRLVEGNVQYGLHEQVTGTILLFSSAESKLAYERDYDRNMQALQVVLRKAGIEQ